jgi:predicted AAA+ superfamily ATPase
MYQRLLSVTTNESFFLFGPRGSGKSTLLRKVFNSENAYFIDLLDDEQERRFASNPNELIAVANALPPQQRCIVIDEVQKIPKLLDVVHLLIEKGACRFALSGSSARKLKRGGANLLAGRAFVFHLFPLTFTELGSDFSLKNALQWGTLPKILSLSVDKDRKRFLSAYANTYLKEEIWSEQLVRNADAFRRFLEVAAQCNGKILNYSKVAQDTGVEDKTVKTYYEILCDTLVGFQLEAYHPSFRKRFSHKPKFFFYDLGVARVLANLADVPIHPSTSYYGELFEQFIILEIYKLISYFEVDFRLSYLLTASGVEVDLIIERPAQTTLVIEIKSGKRVSESDLSNLVAITKEMENAEAICLYDGTEKLRYHDVELLPWRIGITDRIFEAQELLRSS